MKKIIALVVAIVMMASMSVVVFAAAGDVSYNEAVSAAGGNNCTVTYTTSESYTLKIPSAIELETATNVEASVQVTDLSIAANSDLTVTVSAEAPYYDNGKWYLVENGSTGADPVEYTITKTAALESGDTVLTAFTGTRDYDNEEDVTLKFYTAGTSHVANYTATITFTVAVGVPT